MPTVCRPKLHELAGDAVALFNQQVWCWGRDIVRPEGNWLLEVGFQRTEPPADRLNCPSLYQLEMAGGRCVVLRGFGVFYGDQARGGIFVPRYKFRPRYTAHPELASPPWTKGDLPRMSRPVRSTQQACAALVQDLVEWIRRYEARVAEQLGVEYRRKTLKAWDDDQRPVVPAERMASAWHDLSLQIASTFNPPRNHPPARATMPACGKVAS